MEPAALFPSSVSLLAFICSLSTFPAGSCRPEKQAYRALGGERGEEEETDFLGNALSVRILRKHAMVFRRLFICFFFLHTLPSKMKCVI